jgi:hypothetical protein
LSTKYPPASIVAGVSTIKPGGSGLLFKKNRKN